MRFLLLLFLFFSASVARAELASLFGIGPQSSAMGGASLLVGRPNAYQVYSAPAALGMIRRVEISLGMQYLEPRLSPFGTLVLNSGGSIGEFRDAGVLPGGGSLLAFALPIGKVRPLTLGGTIYLPFGTLIRVSGTPVNFPFYPLYTDIARNFFFVIGAGYELFDGLAVGVNIRSTTKSTAYYALRADSSVNYSTSAVEARSESRLSYSVVYDNSRFSPSLPWSAGLMYRNYAGMETKLTADVSTFVPVQGSLTSMPSYTPAEWVLMGSARPLPWGKVALDVARVKWSKYVSPYGSGNINSYVIGDLRADANFHDITVFRLGLEEEFPQTSKWLKKIAYRQGFQLHPSPVPDQTGDSNFVDNLRQLFSLGLGLGVANPWHEDDLIDVDLFFQYNLLKNRNVTKSAANKIGAPGYSTGGHILLGGLGATLRF